MRIVAASDSSILVSFEGAISADVHEKVFTLFRCFSALKDPRILNLHPAYNSVLIDFDPLRLADEEVNRIALGLDLSAVPSDGERRVVEIPVCYDEEFGPDLEFVAEHSGASIDEVVQLHSSAEYVVYFLGFSPGFAYLGGLPPQLAVARLPSPRRDVAAGTVGIAGNQTGVYPIDSPGGWRLIGRTPLVMFDPSSEAPSRLQTGDRVRFVPISRHEYEQMAEASNL